MATSHQGHQKVKADVKKAQTTPRIGFNAKKYAGTVKWSQDPVAYQRELRGDD